MEYIYIYIYIYYNARSSECQSHFLSYREIHAPCFEVCDKDRNRLRGTKKEVLNVKTDGT
jgi:hypothetical protein